MEAAERSNSVQGLSRFLDEHEQCDAGFDVERPGAADSGLISITCRGCGKSFEYAPETIEIEREIELSPLPAPIPLASTPPKKSGNRKRDRVIVATLLLAALAAFAAALIRINDAQSGPSSGDSGESAVAQPARPTPPAPEAEAAPDPKTGVEAAAKPAPTRKSAGLENEELLRLERFSLAVPAGWTHGLAEGGTVVGPPGVSPVFVQVFFEDGATGGLRAMAAQSAQFAESRAGGKSAGAAQRTRVAGNPAFELAVHGPTRSDLVLGVLAGSTHYLVLGTIDQDASATQAAAVRRAMRTFRPS